MDKKFSRAPVTVDMMKFFKKKLLEINWSISKKVLFWAVSCMAWSGSFRVHELLSREKTEFDPTVTLLWEDIKLDSMGINGREVEIISVFIKAQKWTELEQAKE